MSVIALFAAGLATALLAWAATGLVLRLLVRFALYDTPNERSSHRQPRPRGGGLALIPVVLAAWTGAALAWGAPSGFWPVVLAALLLGALAWADDLLDLPAALRLAVQAAAVALGLFGLETDALVFQGLLPPLADRVAAGLLWLWFVNLFNFMDGIDGISGIEAASLGLGVALVARLAGWDGPVALAGLLAAAALGFLAWNWPPAKLFLGDVGSVPLGYLLGWLLLLLAARGQWAAALILPLYYLADATITLGRRLARGAKVWQAHREHFYQRAVRAGASHAAVATRVLVCNLALIGLAAALPAGLIGPAPALVLAGLAVALLLQRLARGGHMSLDGRQ